MGRSVKHRGTLRGFAALLGLAILILSGPALGAEERLSIAVMEFKVTGLPKDEVDLLVDYLNNALFETGAFDVLQRNKREMLVKEMEFSASEAADSSRTRQIGKLLASKLLLFGSIGRIGQQILFNTTTVDVETGKVVSTHSRTYPSLEAIIQDFPQVSRALAVVSGRAMFLKKASVLFADDFSAVTWPTGERIYYLDGSYHIYSPDSDWYAWQSVVSEDFIFETEARWVEGREEFGFGVLFRLQDGENYYLFDISRNGHYKVDKKIAGTYYELTPWEKCTAIDPSGSNLLKVEAVGSRLSFYVNNNKVRELSDDTFRSGKLGLFAGGGVHAAFDNLRVYQGNLLLYNTFSDAAQTAASGWVLDQNATVQNGEFVIRAPGNGYFCWRGEVLGNISYQAEAKWLSGAVDFGYGLLFRLQDVGNNYCFTVSANGFYTLGLYQNGTWKSLVAWKKSPKVNERGKNLLKVECLGSLLKLYVNGNLVEELEDGTFTEGRIGLVSFLDISSSFDNAAVFQID